VTSFTFTVPGQPMSWNASYKSRTVHVRDRFGSVMHTAKGNPVTRGGLYKTQEAKDWQDGVRMIARVHKPSDFAAHEVIVVYDFVLARDIDCDNVKKMANDAIAEALGINDRYFYTADFSKVTGSKDPHMMVTVYDRAHHALEIIDL
jgi:hypothetical protein